MLFPPPAPRRDGRRTPHLPSLATYAGRPRGDASEAWLEAAYRNAVRSIGSPRRLTALQRCLIDLASAAHRMAGAPLTLPEVISVRSALARLANHFRRAGQ